MVTRFERLDRTVLFLNLNLLLWVVLIPWSTALIAEHLRDTGSDEHFAAAIYAANLFLMGISFFAIWRYAATRAGCSGSTTRPSRRARPAQRDRRPGLPGRHRRWPG